MYLSINTKSTQTKYIMTLIKSISEFGTRRESRYDNLTRVDHKTTSAYGTWFKRI
jgi:hypothetical protein